MHLAVWHSVSCTCRECREVDRIAFDPGQFGYGRIQMVFLVELTVSETPT